MPAAQKRNRAWLFRPFAAKRGVIAVLHTASTVPIAFFLCTALDAVMSGPEMDGQRRFPSRTAAIEAATLSIEAMPSTSTSTPLSP